MRYAFASNNALALFVRVMQCMVIIYAFGYYLYSHGRKTWILSIFEVCNVFCAVEEVVYVQHPQSASLSELSVSRLGLQAAFFSPLPPCASDIGADREGQSQLF